MLRALIMLIFGLISATAAHAQLATKVPRIGVLHAGSSQEESAIQRDPFERGLREHGWIPGSTVLITYVYGEGARGRLTEAAVQLVRSGVDIIVARGPAAIRAARDATATIPIVMSAGEDAVAEGFAKSLSRPGGNITGIDSLVFDLDAKRLALLKEAFPAVSRVAVLANPNTEPTQYEARIAMLQKGAQTLRVQTQVFEVRRRDDITAAFESIGRGRFDALLVRGDPQVLDPNRAMIVALVAKERMPAIYPWRFFVDAGGLMSYGTSLSGFHHRSAFYVDRILRGARAGDLSIEHPTKFELVVNAAAAKVQGLTISPSVLLRADQILQ